MNYAELLQMLSTAGVKFIVIGGVACALNGYVRATDDVDIIVETSRKNIELLIKSLEKWGEGFARELSTSDFNLSPGAIRIIENFPLDVFTMLNGKIYNDYIIYTKVNKDGITYLNEDALIELKQNTMREKDALDVLALNRTKNENKPREDF